MNVFGTLYHVALLRTDVSENIASIFRVPQGYRVPQLRYREISVEPLPLGIQQKEQIVMLLSQGATFVWLHLLQGGPRFDSRRYHIF
jgi:hypothetical protein